MRTTANALALAAFCLPAFAHAQAPSLAAPVLSDWRLPLLAAPPPPGVAIDHLPDASRIHPGAPGAYIGSPSIAILPDGSYVASHDFFGPGSRSCITRVFRSVDRGKTWEKSADLTGQFWSMLFVHRGALYLMGTSREYGDCVIRRSDDGGRTWTKPKDAQSGLLLTGAQYHTAPVPVVVHGGRIWRGMEDRNPPKGWGMTFRAFVLSAPEDADLLRAESWTASNLLRYDPAWGGRGWLEGNAVVTPGGEVVDILRTDTTAAEGERAAVVRVSADGRESSFDPASGFIALPGAAKKFTIRFDAESKLYWTLVNPVPENRKTEVPGSVRNVLALASSPDLKTWTVRQPALLSSDDKEKVGFQYVDWQFDGADLVAVVRTAFPDWAGGAHNYHDANWLTFLRVEDFRRK